MLGNFEGAVEFKAGLINKNRPVFHLLHPWFTQGSFNLYEVTIIRKQCKEYKVLRVTTLTIKSLLLGANRSFETSGRLH